MAYQLLFDVIRRERRERVFNERLDHITNNVHPTTVAQRYRIDSDTFGELLRGYMESEYSLATRRSHAISESIQVGSRH